MPSHKITRKSRKESSCKTLIMFIDIMGASEVSNHKPPKDYANFVGEFRTIFEETCDIFSNEWLEDLESEIHYSFSARGDEGILFIYPGGESETDSEMSQYVDIALNIALEIKRKWLITSDNQKRISSDILPIDLGVGIHVGQTFIKFFPETQKNARGRKIKPETAGVWRPEGYAINLAKRIESHSRNGVFTRIIVSEAAHAILNQLPDEKTYLFSQPFKIDAKGFSQEIRAYEIRHHFLPTYWSYDVAFNATLKPKKRTPKSQNSRTQRSRIQIYDVGKKHVEIMFNAHKLNPTNLWLAEEYIKSAMVHELYEIYKKEGDNAEERLSDQDWMKNRYDKPAQVAAYICQSDQRDVGALINQGLIEGERLQFDLEQKRYLEAEKLGDQPALLHWYLGVSYSARAFNAIDGNNLNPQKLQDNSIAEFEIRADSPWNHIQVKKYIELSIEQYNAALDISPNSAWIYYDLGCELVLWFSHQRKKLQMGERHIANACKLLDEVKYYIFDEPHLESARGNNGPVDKIIGNLK